MKWSTPARLVAVGLWCCGATFASAEEDSALEIFTRRITPILRSPNPSSCSECHLSGVDLKDYIGETQEQTFAALRSAGLIDMDDPDRSKLLTLILREPEKPSPVGAEARRLEYEAFRSWIRAAVHDPVAAAAGSDSDQLGPAVPVEVIRHTRKERVLRSFVENVWSEMGRCVSCHSPELNRNKIGRNGFTEEDVDAISWVVPRDPAATLNRLVETGNIDLEHPEASPMLTKPVGLEEHGGGPKFALGSRTDKNFRRFLSDYAATINGEYTRTDQLPEESGEIAAATGQHLRIIHLPEQLHQRLLRADVYRRIGDGWSETRIATAENPIVGPRRMWQSALFSVAPRDSEQAAALRADEPIPPGPYLVKIYVDREGKAKEDRNYELGEADFLGQVEIAGEWKSGYQPPMIIEAPHDE